MWIIIHFSRDSMDSERIKVSSDWTLAETSEYVYNNFAWVSYISLSKEKY